MDITEADARCQAAIDAHYARIKESQYWVWQSARRSISQRHRRLTELLLRDYIAFKWAQENQA